MFILILKIIGICIFLVCLGFLAYWGMALLKGDCSLRMLKGKMTPLKAFKKRHPPVGKEPETDKENTDSNYFQNQYKHFSHS